MEQKIQEKNPKLYEAISPGLMWLIEHTELPNANYFSVWTMSELRINLIHSLQN